MTRIDRLAFLQPGGPPPPPQFAKKMVVSSSAQISTARRSTRVPADVLIELQGEGFAYGAETLTLNLHGALVRSWAPLKLGERVTIHVHETGKSAPATIVFADYEQSRFGIELERPENIWGVAAPPSDWNALNPEQPD